MAQNPALNQSNLPASMDDLHLQFLDPHQVAMLDEALATLGDFGELRLVVEKRRLRFIICQKSIDALKWQPGSLQAE
jgi:hypothetical protein